MDDDEQGYPVTGVVPRHDETETSIVASKKGPIPFKWYPPELSHF